MKYTTALKPFSALNKDLKSGKLLLPSFQRNYEWNEKDGLELLDSIYKGYPIGSIYTWLTSTGNKVPSQDFDGIKTEDSLFKITSVAYLIDGQQRLTTLLRLYDKDREFDLFFNPTIAQFKPRKKTETYNFGQKVNKNKRNRLVSVKDIFRNAADENKDFLKKLGEENFNEEEIANILALRDTLDGFTLNVTEVSEAPIMEVLGLYTRINTSGRQLGWVDSLATPILLNVVPDLKIEISNYLKENSKKYEGFEKFFNVEFFLETIIRLIHPKYFNSLQQSSFKEIDLYTERTVKEAVAKVQKGTLATVKLLKNQLRISTSKAIKKDFSILLLVIILGNIAGEPKLPELKILTRYFLLTNIFDFYSANQAQKMKSEHFSRVKNAISLMNNTFNLVGNINQELTRTILEEQGSKELFTLESLKQEQYASGRTTKGFIALELLLSHKDARTFTDFNAPIDFSNSNKHHIYPINYLTTNESNIGEEVVNSIGNITFINDKANNAFSDKSPVEYFSLFAEPTPESLTLHSFPKEYLDYKTLKLEDAKMFIHTRLNTLLKDLNDFLNKFE